jgi:DNA-directed RNA polymerase subunit RPC12/RpoP
MLANMKYICPECGYEVIWTEKDFADRGEPVCPDCDSDMINIKK